MKRKVRIKGMANITGGAFYDKIPRIIPKGLAVEIDKDSWQVPHIFYLIKEKIDLDDREMYRTFNMGIGMVLALPKRDAEKAKDILRSFGLRSYLIGRIVRGNRDVCVY